MAFTAAGISLGNALEIPFASPVTIFTAPSSSNGSISMIPFARLSTIVTAESVIAGILSTSPEISAFIMSTPMFINVGSCCAIRFTASDRPCPITVDIFITSPFASFIPFANLPRISTPSPAKVSRNGKAISDIEFLSPPALAFNFCILSSNAPSRCSCSPLITTPKASASCPSCLKASEPASMIGFSSCADFPNSSIAKASRSVSFGIFPSASMASQYTSVLFLKEPS